jgi:phage anti-repressor protein
MNKNILPKEINFKELVKNSNTTLSLNVQTKMVKFINEEFTDSEQQWYIANLYVYMNYHPTNDFPINLENVFKMIGFANKGNAMKTIKSNFTKDEDYKVELFHTEKRKNEGGYNKEDIMLNADTFKNLCMIAKTDKGKAIRKYYVKLENIYNKIIKEEIETQKLLLEQEKENTIKLIEEKEEQLKLKENDLEAQKLLIKKKDKEIKELAKKVSLDWLYVAVTDNIQGVSKIGIAQEILKRIDGHLSSNPGFKYVFTYQSKNNKLIEKCIKAILDPFLTNKNEWFNIESNDLVYLVKFFIELFDKNNGSEDPKLIIDFIKNISKKELDQEFISNELYDEFFKENIEIDEHNDKNYKCTLISIQKELEEYLNKNNFNKQIKGNVKYLDIYTLDIKRYIKYKYNKTCERINIDDAKSNIHIGSTYGFTGFRMKKIYIDKIFENHIYKNFIDQYLLLDNQSKSSLSEILVVFNKYLKNNNIDDKLVKKNKYFKSSFRTEFLKEIENFYGLNSIKNTNINKKNGYSFFMGIKLKDIL